MKPAHACVWGDGSASFSCRQPMLRALSLEGLLPWPQSKEDDMSSTTIRRRWDTFVGTVRQLPYATFATELVILIAFAFIFAMVFFDVHLL